MEEYLNEALKCYSRFAAAYARNQINDISLYNAGECCRNYLKYLITIYCDNLDLTKILKSKKMDELTDFLEENGSKIKKKNFVKVEAFIDECYESIVSVGHVFNCVNECQEYVLSEAKLCSALRSAITGKD